MNLLRKLEKHSSADDSLQKQKKKSQQKFSSI